MSPPRLPRNLEIQVKKYPNYRSVGLSIVLCGLLASTWACGDVASDDVDGAGVSADSVHDSQTVFEDAGIKNDTVDGQDASPATDADALAPSDDGSVEPGDDVVEDDVSGEDSGPLPLDCPGGPMCECEVNGDCDNSQCIDTPNGKQCAETCITSCSDEKNFKCATVESTGGDVTTICVPKYGRMCDPCTESKACKSLGLSDSLCVVHGEGGAFCGVGCELDAECQTGFTCKQVTSIEKIKGKQCVPKAPAGSEAEFGDCTCSDAAVKQKLQTACYIENIGNDGKVSLCKGKRVCLVAGLTKCTAPKPEAEVCDGIDNDCDGDTDENSCDDSNACTTDACKSEGKCIHIDMSGTPCNADDNVCTANDACQQGLCIPGALKDCNDNNPCTKDACDMATGCTKSNDNGAPCDDDNPCTVGDTCKAGACVSGAAKTCKTEEECLVGKCSPATGKCVFLELDAPCDDGNACTKADACKQGFCTGKAMNCDDANPCTSDVCAKDTGCKSVPNTAPCNDDNACTDSDGCKGGKCVGLAKDVTVACADSNPCTTDICDVSKGCVHINSSKSCEDGNVCTVGDLCDSGSCKAGSNTCGCKADVDCANKDDGNLCNGTLYCNTSKAPYQCAVNPATVIVCPEGGDSACLNNTCDAKTGKCSMVPTQDGKLCDADGSVCSKGDACKGGQCAPGAKVGCDDGKPCTADSCDPKAGCVHKAGAGKCDDGDPCTNNDFCEAGGCKAGVNVCACQTTKDCAAKEDGDLCNGTLYCDTLKAPYQCKVKTSTVVKCDPSQDSNCSASQCDAKTGKCALKPIGQGKSCSDGDACTAGDTCQAGKCAAGGATKCDDNNVCTKDSCDKAKGCQHAVDAITQHACYSGKAGTKGVGLCIGGKRGCKADASFGPCVGEVVPAQAELCNGKDDTCDGKTDGGCAAEGMRVGFGGVRMDATGGSYRLRMRAAGDGVAGPTGGNNKTLTTWGLDRWIRQVIGW